MAEVTAEQAIERLGTAFEEFKVANDLALAEKTDKGSVDTVLTDKIEKLQGVLDTNSEIIENAGTELKSANTRIDELETAIDRSGHGDSDKTLDLELRSQACELITVDHMDRGVALDLNPDDIDPVDVETARLYSKHFSTYIRKDQDAFLRKMGFPNLETKLLSVDRDPGGGYWVKPEMSARIIKFVFETSPIRQFATVETIGTDALEMITDLNQVGFGWVGEQESRAETTTPDIGKRRIPAHELYAEPRATQKMLDDAGFDVESWLARKISERFARVEATAFVSGNGVARPRGIDTYPSGTADQQIEQVGSGTSGAVTADGLFDLVYSLKGPYTRNARFMAARLTIRDIRKLKDGQGRYLWEPNIQVGQPVNILGFPMHHAEDMATVAAGSLSIAFGDFREAYTIVDRKGIRVLRDPFTAKPYVKFYTTKRVGGDVVNFEAIKLQVLT